MTKTLTYPDGYMPTFSHDLEAVPGLAPVPGAGVLPDAQFTMTQAADGTITLAVPDTTDEAAVDAVWAAHDRTPIDRPAVFASASDVERLRLVNERARTDPAYAALADLALGKDRPR
jgi:hypothetical protein